MSTNYELREIGDESDAKTVRLQVIADGSAVGEVTLTRCVEVSWSGDKAHALRAVYARWEDTVIPIMKREKVRRMWAVVWSHRRGLHKFLERLKFDCWNRSVVNVMVMESERWDKPQVQG